MKQIMKSHMNISKRSFSEEEEHESDKEIPAEEEVVIDESSVPPERKLNRAEISIRLSMLGKTANADGYTYLNATCTGLELTDISALKTFRCLQFVNVSDNKLNLNALQAVTELPYLVLLNADNNILTSGALKRCKYLQIMIMNGNQLNSVNDIYQHELSTLEVGENQISEIKFQNKMEYLRVLDFRNNLISDLSDISFPALDSLYLAGNKIKSLIGIASLENLRILHVRKNPIKLLDGFDKTMSKLKYLNMRECKVGTLLQVKKLRVLSSLEMLILKGCPIMRSEGGDDEEDNPEVRVSIIASLPRLKRLNKDHVNDDERAEAQDLMNLWIEEGKVDEEEIIEEEDNIVETPDDFED